MGRAKPIEERLAAAKAKQDALAARIDVLEAKARAQTRKDDTRRKVLVGATIIAQMEKDPAFARMAAGYLDNFIQKPKDRELIAPLLAKRGPSAPPANTSIRPQPVVSATYGARSNAG